MYTKHIDDILEISTTQVASGGGEIVVEKDCADTVYCLCMQSFKEQLGGAISVLSILSK